LCTKPPQYQMTETVDKKIHQIEKQEETTFAINCLNELEIELKKLLSSGSFIEEDRKALATILNDLTKLKLTALELCTFLTPKAKQILAVFSRAQTQKAKVDVKRMRNDLNIAQSYQMCSKITQECKKVINQCVAVERELNRKYSTNVTLLKTTKNVGIAVGLCALAVLMGGFGATVVGMTVAKAVFTGAVVFITAGFVATKYAITKMRAEDAIKAIDLVLAQIKLISDAIDEVQTQTKEVSSNNLENLDADLNDDYVELDYNLITQSSRSLVDSLEALRKAI